MTTRAQQEAHRKAAFQHLLEDVFELNDDSPLHKALEGLGYDDIEDIVMMTMEEVNTLEYKDDYTDPKEKKKPVPMRMKKKLVHALWWFDEESAKKIDGIVECDAWFALDVDEFEEFRAKNASASRQFGS